MNKNWGYKAYSKVADEETFQILQSHIKKLIIQAGVDITSGRVDLNPFQYKTKTGNQWDPYLSVSQFDPSVKESKYRMLRNMTDEEVLQKTKQAEAKCKQTRQHTKLQRPI